MFNFLKNFSLSSNNENLIDKLINLEFYYNKEQLINDKELLKNLIDNCIDNNDIKDVIKVIFYLRNNKNNELREICNKLFYYVLVKGKVHELDIKEIIYKYIGIIGRWDDWIIFFDNNDINNELKIVNDKKYELKINDYKKIIINILINQLLIDIKELNNNGIISLCAKWMPSENKSLDKKIYIVNILSNELYELLVKDNEILNILSKKILENIIKKNKKNVYRNIISILRNNMNLIENYLCQKKDITNEIVNYMPINAKKYYRKKLNNMGFIQTEMNQTQTHTHNQTQIHTHNQTQIHTHNQTQIHTHNQTEKEIQNDLDTISIKSEQSIICNNIDVVDDVVDNVDNEFIKIDKKLKNLIDIREWNSLIL